MSECCSTFAFSVRLVSPVPRWCGVVVFVVCVLFASVLSFIDVMFSSLSFLVPVLLSPCLLSLMWLSCGTTEQRSTRGRASSSKALFCLPFSDLLSVCYSQPFVCCVGLLRLLSCICVAFLSFVFFVFFFLAGCIGSLGYWQSLTKRG